MDICRAVRGRTQAMRLRTDTLEIRAGAKATEECFLGIWEVKDREIIVRCLKCTHDYQEQHKSVSGQKHPREGMMTEAHLYWPI